MPLALRSRACFITLPIPTPFLHLIFPASQEPSLIISYLLTLFFQYTQVGDLVLTARLAVSSGVFE